MKQIITMLAVLFCLQANAQLTNYDWGHRIGSSVNDEGLDIACDNAGNTYCTGYYEGTFTAGTTTLTHSGNRDAYLIKRNAAGAIVWAKKFGGTGQDYGYGVTVDNFGNVYLTGWFSNTVDFDPNAGVTNMTSAGGTDIFLVKLTSAGNLAWARRQGGSGNDRGYDVAINYIFSGVLPQVVGSFSGSFDTDPDPNTTAMVSSAGSTDGFIWTLNSSGNSPGFYRYGGSGADAIYSIDVDNNNRNIVTGSFSGTVDFNQNSAVVNLTSSGGSDMFVAKYQWNSALDWVRKVGGSGNDVGNTVTVSGSDIYVGGHYRNTTDFDPGTSVANSTMTSGAAYNGYVLKLNNSGNYLWHKVAATTVNSNVKGLAANSVGGVAVAGDFVGTMTLPSSTDSLVSSTTDLFIWTLDPNGTLTGGYSAGSFSFDRAAGVAIDGNDNLYFTGTATSNIDLNVLPGINNSIGLGNADGYIMKYAQSTCTITYGATTSPIACNSYSSPTSSAVWSVSGTYYDTLVNAASCDSIITYNVTINNATTSTINPTVCGSYVSPNNTTYTSSGTYTNVLTNAAGCDSTITINLTVNQPTTSTINPTVCGSYVSPNNTTYTSSGTYTNVINNAAGCDSTITINLTVNQPTTSTINPTVCDTYVSPNNTTYTSSGTYTNVINNAAGCDSTITINLTVNTSTTNSITIAECDSFISAGNNTYTASGTYTEMYTNAAGCDSTLTINLTINPSPTPTISFNGTDLSTMAGMANYEWKRNSTTITGATSDTYTPTQNGMYEVTVTDANGCTGTASYTVSALSVKNFATAKVSIYPNPVRNELTIELDNTDLQITVRDMSGKAVLKSNENKINVASLSNGMYFLEAIQKGNRLVTKFIKE